MGKNISLSRVLKNIGWILIIVLTLFIYCGIYKTDYVRVCHAEEEYSEEEKAAAKAWLSAHGYPPTRAGAQQAYEDYLNGKFDDDPEVRKRKGLDPKTNENDNPPAQSSEDKEEKATENDASIQDVLILPSIEDLKKTAFQEELNQKSKLLVIDRQNQYSLIYTPEEKKNDITNALIIVFLIIAVLSVGIVAFINIKKANSK